MEGRNKLLPMAACFSPCWRNAIDLSFDEICDSRAEL
jgi:hypothetical protein